MGSDSTANQVDEKLSNIVAAVGGINRRLGDLEARTGFIGDSGPVSFADVINPQTPDGVYKHISISALHLSRNEAKVSESLKISDQRMAKQY